jgi:hypothetical protein
MKEDIFPLCKITDYTFNKNLLNKIELEENVRYAVRGIVRNTQNIKIFLCTRSKKMF